MIKILLLGLGLFFILYMPLSGYHFQTRSEITSSILESAYAQIPDAGNPDPSADNSTDISNSTNVSSGANDTSDITAQNDTSSNPATTVPDVSPDLGNLVENATISSNATVSEEYKDSFQAYTEENADSQHEITLTLSKYLYQPGDEVELKGSVFSDIIAKLNETNKVVSIKIITEEDQVIAENNNIGLDNNGNFEVLIPLPENVTAGDYDAKVTLSANTNTAVLETSTEVQLEADASFTVVTKPIPFDIKAEGEDFNVQVATNSTVDNVQLEESQKKLNVIVEGKDGTRGVADVEIPKNMLSGTITVTIDGVDTKNFKIIKETDTLLIVEVSYHHSKHTISIQGTSVVPEFGPVSALVLTVSIVSIILISGRTRLKL